MTPDLHIERMGAGPPMVLVHGLGSSHAHWLGVAPALATDHRLHLPDLPGFGLTPRAGRDVDVESNAAVIEELLDSIRRPAVLVGHSMGALITLLAARGRPAGVESLVLVAPPAPRPLNAHLEPSLWALFSAYAWPGLGELTRSALVRLHGPEGMARNLLETCCVNPDAAPPAVVREANRVAARRSPDDEVDAFLAAYRSTWTYVLNSRRFDALLRSIQVPTLVIQGAADRLIPPVVARRFARVRPDWTHVVLPAAGHLPQVDDPEAFLRAFRRWRRKLAA